MRHENKWLAINDKEDIVDFDLSLENLRSRLENPEQYKYMLLPKGYLI